MFELYSGYSSRRLRKLLLEAERSVVNLDRVKTRAHLRHTAIVREIEKRNVELKLTKLKTRRIDALVATGSPILEDEEIKRGFFYQSKRKLQYLFQNTSIVK